MMKLIVDDIEYDLTAVLRQASLGDLFKLKIKTKRPDYPGVSVKSIQTTFKQMAEKAKIEGFNGLDLLDDEEFLINMQGLIYLARRNAGEQLEVADAGDTAWSSFELTDEDDEEDEGEGDDDAPKAPVSSDPDEPSVAPAQ